MAYLQLPIRNDLPAYDFQTDLEGVVYVFTIRYNERASRWYLDIRDESGNDIVIGIVLLVNQNLLGRFRDIRLPPGTMFCINEASSNVQPDRLNFSNDVRLIYRESTTDV